MENTKEKVWAVLTEPAGLKDIAHGSDVMTLREFFEYIQIGGFIDYDGFGKWATQTKLDPHILVYPSGVRNGTIVPPKWATHVVWYNR